MEAADDISIHALREEGDVLEIRVSLADFISIHALREEGDQSRPYTQSRARTISIHALREEGDSKNIQICNIAFVYSAYKTIYFCNSCAFCLT